jgi:Fe-S oxidoreductase
MMFLRSKGKMPKGYNNLLHWRGKRLGLLERSLYGLKKIKDKPSLFYFACYAYSPSEIPQKTLAVADHLGFDYEVMAGYSYCCGWPHFLAGDFERAEALFVDLFNTVNEVGVKTVVTGCAECYRALKFICDRFAGDFEVLTTPQWLVQNLRRLKLKKTGEKVTFHDACQLSRLDDKADVPRKLVKKLFDLVEMRDNRKNTLCCGGMRAGHSPDGLYQQRKKRLADAMETGATTMVTECVTCFEKYSPLAKELHVMDLTETVHDMIIKSTKLPKASDTKNE